MDVLVGQMLKGLPYLHLTLLLLGDVLLRVLFLSLSGSDRGNSGTYCKGLPAMLERMGNLVSLSEKPNTVISAPKLADF